MSWLGDLKRSQRERQELIQLRRDIDDCDKELQRQLEGLKPRDDLYQSRLGAYIHNVGTLEAAVAQIETAQMRRRAERWRIPLPPRPREEAYATDFWEWHDKHGKYYFSEKALSQIRRELYMEWEMWWKPWLSWLAIGISFLSLAIAIFKP
ncbi:hypothetical protein [Rhizobium halophytocola]|uniref:Uncharacterized protein n=1 Tax=Rhizobium halophytocola TaxID=735519 RepID=A0ABS4E495_9HYPH|nr:hypothetical protein [Rhizobium halophytocola]MBP1852724.1 hypothetical protein [Rhizobium halophytocola]